MKRLLCTTSRIKLIADIERSQLKEVLEAVSQLEYLVSAVKDKRKIPVLWDLIDIPAAEAVGTPPAVAAAKKPESAKKPATKKPATKSPVAKKPAESKKPTAKKPAESKKAEPAKKPTAKKGAKK